MPYLSSTTKTRLQARLVTKENQLTALEDAYDVALESGHIQEYRFDSGEGSQRTEYRNVQDLQKAIRTLEADIESIRTRLRGSGVVGITLRRYRC